MPQCSSTTLDLARSGAGVELPCVHGPGRVLRAEVIVDPCRAFSVHRPRILPESGIRDDQLIPAASEKAGRVAGAQADKSDAMAQADSQWSPVVAAHLTPPKASGST